LQLTARKLRPFAIFLAKIGQEFVEKFFSKEAPTEVGGHDRQ
jgi:hypothetical protein